MEPHIEGLLLVYSEAFLYFQNYNDTNITLDSLEKFGKKCKVSSDKHKEIRILLNKIESSVSIDLLNEIGDKQKCGQVSNAMF